MLSAGVAADLSEKEPIPLEAPCSGQIKYLSDTDSAFYVAAVVKPLSAYFFPFLFWGRCPLVQSRLAALVDTQLRLTHVLPPMRVQTRSIPLALFPPLT